MNLKRQWTRLQTGLPMAAMAVVAGQLKLKAADRTLLNQQMLPWALRAATRSTDLMSVYYEQHFEVRNLRCVSS